MKFVLTIAVVAVICGGVMYKFDPSQFNSMLDSVGITAWHAPT